jgi:hypothetical protein
MHAHAAAGGAPDAQGGGQGVRRGGAGAWLPTRTGSAHSPVQGGPQGTGRCEGAGPGGGRAGYAHTVLIRLGVGAGARGVLRGGPVELWVGSDECRRAPAGGAWRRRGEDREGREGAVWGVGERGPRKDARVTRHWAGRLWERERDRRGRGKQAPRGHTRGEGAKKTTRTPVGGVRWWWGVRACVKGLERAPRAARAAAGRASNEVVSRAPRRGAGGNGGAHHGGATFDEYRGA